jgi:hypothetical protein
MAESKWNGVRYDFGDETDGPFDGPEGPPSRVAQRPGSPVASDLARRKRKAPSASTAPVAGPAANTTREFYDRQLQEQQRAREAFVAGRGESDLAARSGQAADRADAAAQAGAAQMTAEQQRREQLRRMLIGRVQDMMVPFQRAGLPTIAGGR